MDSLTGKVYAITGGNSGIGLAAARELVRRGAQVAIFGRDAQTLAEAQRELGAMTAAVQGDVTRADDLRRFFAAIAERFSELDGVFVNAGIAAFAPIDAITDEHIASHFDINFTGAIRTIQQALPLLREGSAIVLNGSINTTIGMPGASIYSASKAASVGKPGAHPVRRTGRARYSGQRHQPRPHNDADLRPAWHAFCRSSGLCNGGDGAGADEALWERRRIGACNCVPALAGFLVYPGRNTSRRWWTEPVVAQVALLCFFALRRRRGHRVFLCVSAVRKTTKLTKKPNASGCAPS